MWPSADSRLPARVAETLMIATVGGAILGLARFPAGWLSGAILAVTVAALMRRPMVIPAPLGRACIVAVGISLGSAVTPATLMRMAAWPASLVALALAMIAVTAAVAFYLHRVHGWDALSALFAAAPGALAQSLALAADTEADVRSVAMVQAVRILVLTVGLPLGFAAFGVAGVAPARGTPVSFGSLASLAELAGLIAAASAAAVLAYRLTLPGGLIVGAMAASGLLHGAGLITVSLPPAVATASFVVLGAVIGERFVGADVLLLRRLTMIGLGALAVGMAVALAFAAATATLLSLRFGDVVIAYAPGGLEAMTILAFALHLDPVFVGIHQIARFVVISLLMPFAVRGVRGATAADAAPSCDAPATAVPLKEVSSPEE
jgi:membrane AbrB-like protein